MLVAGPIWILTLGSALGHVFLGHISRADAAGLTDNFYSGIAWMLRAPAVYMLCIPILGIAGDTVAHLTGRRLAPYGAFQGMIAAFGVLSFGVWTQSAVAGQTIVWVAFVVLAALPVLAMVGGLADSLRRGRPTVAASLGAVLLAHLLLLGAALTAALLALDTAGSGTLFGLETGFLGDAQTLFVVAAATLGALGGLFHWSERIFGVTVPEGAARSGTAAVLLGGGLAATVLLVEGIAAGDGRDGLPDGLVFGLVAAGAALFALGVLAGLAAALGAARQGYEGGTTGSGETTGLTLEWSTTGLAIPTGPDAPATFVRSPYPLLDLRDGGPSDEEKS
jgi:heme/copper-type cytochrome/quinol oxidase subunit 1